MLLILAAIVALCLLLGGAALRWELDLPHTESSGTRAGRRTMA